MAAYVSFPYYTLVVYKLLQKPNFEGKLTKADLERVVRSGPKIDIQERRFNEKRNEKWSQWLKKRNTRGSISNMMIPSKSVEHFWIFESTFISIVKLSWYLHFIFVSSCIFHALNFKKSTHSNEDTQNNIVVSRTPSSTTTQQPDSYPTDQKQ